MIQLPLHSVHCTMYTIFHLRAVVVAIHVYIILISLYVSVLNSLRGQKLHLTLTTLLGILYYIIIMFRIEYRTLAVWIGEHNINIIISR